MPGTAVAVPSDLLMERSAVAVTFTTASAELFVGVGSVTDEGTAALAVFVSGPPGYDTATEVVIKKVATAAGAKLTVVPMFPEPEAAVQVPVPVMAQVHVAEPSPAGRLSVTEAPVTVDGPVLVTVMV